MSVYYNWKTRDVFLSQCETEVPSGCTHYRVSVDLMDGIERGSVEMGEARCPMGEDFTLSPGKPAEVQLARSIFYLLTKIVPHNLYPLQGSCDVDDTEVRIGTSAGKFRILVEPVASVANTTEKAPDAQPHGLESCTKLLSQCAHQGVPNLPDDVVEALKEGDPIAEQWVEGRLRL